MVANFEPSSPRYQVGVNRKVVGKTDPDKLSYVGCWQPERLTLEQLARHIANGNPWMPATVDKGKRRVQSACNYTELLTLDIDDGMTMDEAIAHPFVNAHCALGVESASSTPELHKFRLVFPLVAPIDGWELIKSAHSYLQTLLDTSDKACKDANRFYFGASGREPFILNDLARLPADFIERVAQWEAQLEAERQARADARAEEARVRAEQRQQLGLSGDTDLIRLIEEAEARLGTDGFDRLSIQRGDYRSDGSSSIARVNPYCHESKSKSSAFISSSLEKGTFYYCPSCKHSSGLFYTHYQLRHGVKSPHPKGKAFVDAAVEFLEWAGDTTIRQRLAEQWQKMKAEKPTEPPRKQDKGEPQPQRAGGEIVLHPSLESDTADVRTKFKHVSQQAEKNEAALAEALARQVELLSEFNAAAPLKQCELKPALSLIKAEITRLNTALKPLNRQRTELKKLVTALDIQDRQQTAKAGKDDRSSWKQDVEVMEARLIGRLRYNTLKEMAEIDMGDWWEPLSPNSVNYQMKHAIGFDNWKQSDNANSRILRDMAQKEPFGRRYNPVRDYLNDLGQRIEPDFELLDTLAKRVFNIDDPLQNLFIKAAIIAAVARGIAEDDAAPIKWRHMPILVGEQHCGKSDFIRYLVGGEENPGNIFGSGQLEFKTKDSIIESRPFWIFEFEEVDTVLLSRGSVQSSIKAFLSRVTDSYRPVHGRDTIEVKRFTTFWGTSNNEHLLSDSSGDSRFLIIRIPDGYSVPDHIWRWLIANRDLIWGTAVHAYFREGIPRIATDVLKEHNQEFQNHHHWHDAIAAWVAARAEAPTTGQILEHALGIETGRQKDEDSQAVKGIMQRIGYKTQRVRVPGSTERAYVWVPKT